MKTKTILTTKLHKIRTNKTIRTSMAPLLGDIIDVLCVVCVCVCACARVCVCVCMCVYVFVGRHVCINVCMY